MRISVIMVDGGFRQNAYSAEYFAKQDFSDYELIWVDYYDKINPKVARLPDVCPITLNRIGTYHSSYCFNKGITEASGEVIVVPDADQIVRPDFLSKVWQIHSHYDNLVTYGYRYDEICKDTLKSFCFEELENKCILKNPLNFGGCLTVRKKWLLEVNGYEQHPIFRTGYHANGLDLYIRFKNLGLAIQWHPDLKLYHPWHPYTLQYTHEQKVQKMLIKWRHKSLQWEALRGIDSTKKYIPSEDIQVFLEEALKILDKENPLFFLPVIGRQAKNLRIALWKLKHVILKNSEI